MRSRRPGQRVRATAARQRAEVDRRARRASPPRAGGSRRAGCRAGGRPAAAAGRGSGAVGVRRSKAAAAAARARRAGADAGAAARLDDARARSRARARGRRGAPRPGSGPMHRRPPGAQHARLLARDRGERAAEVHLVVEVDADDRGGERAPRRSSRRAGRRGPPRARPRRPAARRKCAKAAAVSTSKKVGCASSTPAAHEPRRPRRAPRAPRSRSRGRVISRPSTVIRSLTRTRCGEV